MKLQQLHDTPGLSAHPTINEVAVWYGVDPRTVRRWLREGLVKGRRLGPRLIRLDRDSVLNMGRPVGSAR